MENEPANNKFSKAVKLTVLTVLTHSLLPLVLFPLSLYVMPHFMSSFLETGMNPSACLRILSAVTSFVGGHWGLYALLLAAAIIVDAAICFSLFRSGRKVVGDLWSAFVIFIQAAFAAVCALAFASVYAA